MGWAPKLRSEPRSNAPWCLETVPKSRLKRIRLVVGNMRRKRRAPSQLGRNLATRMALLIIRKCGEVK